MRVSKVDFLPNSQAPIAEGYRSVLESIENKMTYALKNLEGTKVGPDVGAQLVMLRDEVGWCVPLRHTCTLVLFF